MFVYGPTNTDLNSFHEIPSEHSPFNSNYIQITYSLSKYFINKASQINAFRSRLKSVLYLFKKQSSGMKRNSQKKTKIEQKQDQSDDQDSFDQKSIEPTTQDKWTSKFEALYASRDRFLDFTNYIGDLKTRDMREDLLSHCQRNARRQRSYQSNISLESILRIMNLRIQKMMKNKRIKKNWSQEDVQILLWIISKHADKQEYSDVEKDLTQQDWNFIASLIPGVRAESCMFKWLSLRKTNLATNCWSQQQSELLVKLVNQTESRNSKKDTKDWKLISQRLYFLSERSDKIYRNAKQCREHWNCYLNPNLKKGPWKPQQDVQLMRCIRQNKGSKRWSQIVKHFDGRTQNALKNRYTLLIDKHKKHNKTKTELQIIQQFLQKCYVDQFTAHLRPQQMQHIDIQQQYDSLAHSNYQNRNNQQIDVETPFKEKELNQQNTASSESSMAPIKIQKLNLNNLMAMDKMSLRFIQAGTLSNGIFEKTAHQVEKVQSNVSDCIKRVKRQCPTIF